MRSSVLKARKILQLTAYGRLMVHLSPIELK